METATEVESFLNDFKVKLKHWGLEFRSDRTKNAQTLADLELTIMGCKDILGELTLGDYCEGPVPDTLHKEVPLWVFGKMIKGNEIYIKVTLGKLNSKAICISFHKAEKPLRYPLRH